jgi:hypothetical protein
MVPSANFSIFYHTPCGVDDDDISLDFDDVSIPSYPSKRGPPAVNPCCQPFLVPTPKSSRSSIDDFVPKSKQIEADFWQARLGHCSDWQLKVLPMSVEGLPSHFQPHPFACYDHYNQARIRKRPATRGKHPSRAVTKKQRWFMDFGFL